METGVSYKQFIKNTKQNILHSKYLALRLANQEQLKLYFRLGQMLSEKANAENYDGNIIEQIAEDLQQQLSGLKGFSSGHFKKMQQFYNAYAHLLIEPALLPECFYGISFTHHILIFEKCQKENERLFYISQAAEQCWSVRKLEGYITANFFKRRGNTSTHPFTA